MLLTEPPDGCRCSHVDCGGALGFPLRGPNVGHGGKVDYQMRSDLLEQALQRRSIREFHLMPGVAIIGGRT